MGETTAKVKVGLGSEWGHGWESGCTPGAPVPRAARARWLGTGCALHCSAQRALNLCPRPLVVNAHRSQSRRWPRASARSMLRSPSWRARPRVAPRRRPLATRRLPLGTHRRPLVTLQPPLTRSRRRRRRSSSRTAGAARWRRACFWALRSGPGGWGAGWGDHAVPGLYVMAALLWSWRVVHDRAGRGVYDGVGGGGDNGGFEVAC